MFCLEIVRISEKKSLENDKTVMNSYLFLIWDWEWLKLNLNINFKKLGA